jgi:hypothetical protein
MALTILEAAKRDSGDVLKAAVVETYARTSDILRVLPFENIAGNALKYNQEQALPGIGFRGVNEGYTESTGVLNPVTETLAIAGGDVDVDKFIVQTMGSDQRTSQEQMKIKALAHRWSHAFIKGDSSALSKEYDGLQTRITGNQLIDNGASSGGDVLSLANLDALIDAVDNPEYLLMPKALRRRLTAAARDPSIGGYITYTKDEFGRQVTMYNDLPILIADNNGDVFKTLAFDEANPGGGSSVGTSIYCLAFGEGQMVGIQNGDVMVTDIGEMETKPALRTRVEWYAGIAVYHPRSIARLRGIKDGAVVK